MHVAALLHGPLDGLTVQVSRPFPERLTLRVPAHLGGPGVALYDLDADAVFPRYRFTRWQTQQVNAAASELGSSRRVIGRNE